MQEETVIFWLFSFVIAGGVAVVISAMRYRARVLEMVHRERLAMIERGLRPAGSLGALENSRPRTRSTRMLSGGIVIVGLGLALAMVIGFASGAPDIAAGVGGAVAILGAAFIVTAYVTQGSKPEPEPEWPAPRRFDAPPTPPAPPLVPPNDER